jgi:mannosyltransferase OCH1-like enzyme
MGIFEILVRKSQNFREDIFKNDPRWKLLEELYNKNYLDDTNRVYNLPKKIHQIWFGGNMPEEYQKYADTWRKFNPDWEYKLWTEKDVNDVEIPRRELFNSITHVGQKSDFLRYHILNQYGGLYVDTDFECLRSFESLRFADFITGVGYPANVELYIGLIACTPNHPIIKNVVQSMDQAVNGTWRKIFETTGSYFFTEQFFKVVKGYEPKVIVLPTDYFYPFPNYVRDAEPSKKYIMDWSFAVHYWRVSWSRKKRV